MHASFPFRPIKSIVFFSTGKGKKHGCLMLIQAEGNDFILCHGQAYIIYYSGRVVSLQRVLSAFFPFMFWKCLATLSSLVGILISERIYRIHVGHGVWALIVACLPKEVV